MFFGNISPSGSKLKAQIFQSYFIIFNVENPMFRNFFFTLTNIFIHATHYIKGSSLLTSGTGETYFSEKKKLIIHPIFHSNFNTPSENLLQIS